MLSEAGPRRKAGRAATAVLVAASVAPDSDAVLALFGREAYLGWHMTVTHSLPGVLVMAAAIALLARRFTSMKELPAAFTLSLLAMGVHLAMDVTTPWGTAVLWPLSGARYALDWVATTDAFVWGLLAAGTAAAWAFRRWAVAAARISLALLGGYVLFCAMGHGSAVEYFRESMGRVRVRPSSIQAFPGFPDPLTWNVVATTQDRYWQGRVHSLLGLRGRLAMYLRNPVPAALDSPAVQSYMEWARLPLLTFHSTGLEEASLCDLRFLGRSEGMPFAARLFKSALPGAPAGLPGKAPGVPGRFEWSDSMAPAPPPDMEYELPGG